MHKTRSSLAVLWSLLLPCSAVAQPAATVHASYAGSALGIEVMKLETTVTMDDAGYHVGLSFRTVGLMSVFASSEQHMTVWGGWRHGVPVPQRFRAWGSLRGAARETLIDYDNGQPSVRALTPANDGEREEVPAPVRGGTLDTLSAIAFLVRLVADTGGCDGHTRVFDGRRLTEIGAHTVGGVVPADGEAGSYQGMMRRCDFTGRQLAGFLLEDSTWQRQPHNGTAWMARAVPGGPPLPVRLIFETRWVGEIDLVLTDAGSGPLPPGPVPRSAGR